jgi:hypothetical protein
MVQHLGDNYSYDLYGKELGELRDAMLTLKVLGSMRALMTAGPALKREKTVLIFLLIHPGPLTSACTF